MTTAAPAPETSGLKIETRTIDYVPLDERHGKVWHLGPFWFTGNFVLTTMVTGFVGPSLGLAAWQSVLAILLGVAMVLVVGTRWAATATGRLRLHSLLLDIPLFGKVLRNLQFAVYFRTFGILLQRGVPMVDALRIAVDTLTNTALRKDIEPLVSLVKAGKRLSTGFVSPYLGKSSTPQLIRVAEETGQLDATLLGLADRYEDEGRRTMGRVLAAMEPLIIIVLGALVAFIIIAILGGVLSINDTI